MMDLLAGSTSGLVITVAVLGLLIGSFLNVVIYRLPVMMENEWKRNTLADDAEEPPKFNLVTPASTCPECGHKIRARENIPVISYLFLRGRCISCSTSIPLQYPLVEVLTAILSAMAAWQLGFG
ncbi:MAG TPA: prepilin peptidase, partial [Gammaproteobacteria bacterium]|nr:prepilin peptidase [Gammaproteobacteria bacterium]